MNLDIKRSEGRERFDEEFDRHMKDVVAKKEKLDWENG